MASYPYSFPLRMDLELTNNLHTASIESGLSKSQIIRISIQKFLTELNASGINETLAKLKGF